MAITENIVLTTQELSKYLKINEKTVLKLVQSGKLPGFKIGNQWRFYLSAIDEYLQDKVTLSSHTKINNIVKLTDILPLSRLINENSVNLNIKSKNRDSVLNELAVIAKKAGIISSTKLLFDRLREREEMLSTSLGNKIAVPHPRNPNAELFFKPAIIIARSEEGVDFQAPDGSKIHLFFMTCATDVILHLKLLSKVAALLNINNMFKNFMSADSKKEIMKILLEHERIKMTAI